MPNINENIAKNITKLRKLNNLKQSDLADKLNYSDKAVSKWERGESIPDIECLSELAGVFNVSIDYLTKEHSDAEIKKANKDTTTFVHNLLIMILLCVSLIFISTIAFVYGIISAKVPASKMWVSFVIAVPFISLIVELYGRRFNYWLVRIISTSVILWSILTSIYLVALVNGITTLWMLYFIGAPIQAAICLILFTKKIK